MGFLVIIVVIGGGFFVWDKYLSPAAKSRRQIEKQYEAYMEWEKRHLDALKQDTYGGKTPEETLKMFIEALKKEDIDLASKYFALDTNENSENYLTRKKWEDGLKKAKEEGRLINIAELLSKAVFDEESSFKGTAWFIVKNKKGELEADIVLIFNKESNVWKIESL